MTKINPSERRYKTDIGYGFYHMDDDYYLVRCHECGLENYALMVCKGQCAWCGSTKRNPKGASNDHAQL